MVDSDPGRVPDAAELALRSAGELVVIESNARLDGGDLEGALDLYTDDASLNGMEGKSAIRKAMKRQSAAGAGRSACHVVTNVRPVVDGDSVAIHCTLVAYLLDSPRPNAVNAIVNTTYVMKPQADGNLRIVEQHLDEWLYASEWVVK